MLAGKVGSWNHGWSATLVAYSCAEYTSRFGTLSWTGNCPAPSRLPPHQVESPPTVWMPSTKISRFGLTDSTALPARSAASRQSTELSPQPVHHVVRGVEAEPVDAGDPQRRAGRVQDLPAAGMPVAGAGRVRRRSQDRREHGGEHRERQQSRGHFDPRKTHRGDLLFNDEC